MIPIYQLLVAGSGLLAGLPVGYSVNFPSVLLHQLSLNDSSIQLDWDTASWIGSIHGLAAIPSILMPALMQWKGRKLAFILACLVSIVGWIIAFTATTMTSILVSECLHGFGSQSIMTVGLLTLSEMLAPNIRNVSLTLYLLAQTIGMALVGILGSYLYWKTATLVVCVPLIITVIAASMWPESPSWLACKGKFNKCEKSFILLRGTGEAAQAELEELILAQKENLSRVNKKRPYLKVFWKSLRSRDFYLPGIHMFVLLYSVYWMGGLAIIIYSSDIIQKSTNSKDAVVFGNMLLNISLFLGSSSCIVLSRYFQPKCVLFISDICSVVSLLSASGVSYLQSIEVISKESYMCLYFLVLFMYITNICSPIVFNITSELMPVKHRGLGGPLFAIIACLLHTFSMKLTPYLFKYFTLWGTLLFFAVNGFLSSLYVFIYVPETKGRTLQQLEDYYNYGNMEKRRAIEFKSLQESMLLKK